MTELVKYSDFQIIFNDYDEQINFLKNNHSFYESLCKIGGDSYKSENLLKDIISLETWIKCFTILDNYKIINSNKLTEFKTKVTYSLYDLRGKNYNSKSEIPLFSKENFKATVENFILNNGVYEKEMLQKILQNFLNLSLKTQKTYLLQEKFKIKYYGMLTEGYNKGTYSVDYRFFDTLKDLENIIRKEKNLAEQGNDFYHDFIQKTRHYTKFETLKDMIETEFFKVIIFKNGNFQFTFKNDADRLLLNKRINKILGDCLFYEK